MAKYYITYKCGHEATVQINGTNVHGERERKAAWYGTMLPCLQGGQDGQGQ